MRKGVEGELAVAYLEADRRQRVLHSKIGCVLALVLMPAGASLDFFVYPEHFWALFSSRLLCDVAVLAVLGLLFTRIGERHIRVLGIAWALLPCVAISWMVYYTDGVVSMYYAGLNLVIIAVSLLMPWTLGEVLATCGITLMFYLAAVTGHAWYLDKELLGDNTRDLFNNVYFLALTAVICATASYFLSRLRFQDWRLQHELELRNTEINESYKKLAALDRLKSEFFANVSHELRTPLTLILAPIDEILRRGGTGNEKSDSLMRIARENGLRLLRLVNDMLDLVRMDVKGAELQKRKTNLSDYVPGLIHSAAHLAESKSLQLEVEAPIAPIWAEIDSNAFEKILLNIFTNAVKFTPSGGRIDVKLRAEGENAAIEIIDTGIGISAEDLPRVFERFGQVDSSSTRQYSGVGIGLALSRELAEAHGGTLTATSQKARGTTMRVEIPLKAPLETGADWPDEKTGEWDDTETRASDSIVELHAQARRSLAAVPEADPPSFAFVEGEGDDVLVVDDEPEMRRFIVSLLGENFRVHQAADGLKGLELALAVKPKLALLDVMMPGIDGLELCRRLRAEPSLEGLKIVILTARNDEEAKITALEHGAHDFLIKPFSTLELRTRVSNLLKSAELEVTLRRTNDELRTTLRTLSETEEQLIASEKLNALGTLAAGLLHEINNPLNFTLAATQLAVMNVQDADSDMKETLSDIESGMKRIKDIVTDLKTFAYPDKEKQARHQVFPVQRAVESAMRIAQHSLLDIDVEVEIPAEVRVQASETQVVQVLINLVTNGIRAIEKKTHVLKAAQDTSGQSDEYAPEPLAFRGRIEVKVRDEGQRVKLCVRDNGTGIPKESISKVFDPFYTTREPGQGMGLGLSICHTIVRNHGGRIIVDSVLGEWTEVCFDVPADHEELD